MARKMCLSIPLGAILAGCGAVPGLTGPRDFDLPAEMSSVVDHQDRYRIANDHELWEVTPGDIIDPADHLAGCWGSYTKVKADNEWNDPAGDYYEVFAFDLEHQRVRWTSYIKQRIEEPYQGLLGERMTTLAIYEGELQTAAPTEVASTVRVTTYDTQPAFMSLGAEDILEGETETWLHQFTIDGEYVIQTLTAGTCDETCEATGAGSVEIYRRVPCDYGASE
jgi:hypothetical protein